VAGRGSPGLPGGPVVAILFEASPGFQPNRRRARMVCGGHQRVAILFEASPGFQPFEEGAIWLVMRRYPVAILFEASPGFQHRAQLARSEAGSGRGRNPL
jgi:ribosomal protein S6E (S10)